MPALLLVQVACNSPGTVSLQTERLFGTLSYVDGKAEIEGMILEDDVRALADAARRGGLEELVLDSGGGTTAAGLALAALIANTQPRIVAERCASACALAVVPAKQLKIVGSVGFHMPFALEATPNRAATEAAARADVVRFLREHGVRDAAIARIEAETDRHTLLEVKDTGALRAFLFGG